MFTWTVDTLVKKTLQSTGTQTVSVSIVLNLFFCTQLAIVDFQS